MAESVLVVDDDPDVARFVEVNLRSAGHEVTLASDGEEALAMAAELRPDLILLDVMMPKLDGFEVAQRLRRDPRTSSCSIIMLTAKALSADKVLGLSSGADDYIIKPFDPVELLARGVLYLDLDHFKAYNDHYGFVRGDRAIQAVARLASEVVHEMADESSFVGHVGGDDFLIITPPELAEAVAQKLCERFDLEVPALYDRIDLERGTVEIEDRQGTMRTFPLLSVSIGGVSAPPRRFAHFGEVVAIATEMKQVAKRTPGSSFAFDRRTG